MIAYERRNPCYSSSNINMNSNGMPYFVCYMILQKGLLWAKYKQVSQKTLNV